MRDCNANRADLVKGYAARLEVLAAATMDHSIESVWPAAQADLHHGRAFHGLSEHELRGVIEMFLPLRADLPVLPMMRAFGVTWDDLVADS